LKVTVDIMGDRVPHSESCDTGCCSYTDL